MSLQHLPAEIQSLIVLLDSTDQLEVLLFVSRMSSHLHAVESVADALGLSREIVATAFRELELKRLVRAVRSDTHITYQYAPATIALHAAVEELAAAYPTHAVAIVKALCDKPNLTLRAFADAFRVRRRSEP